ncbi:hypothetical protein CQ047_11760 [Microbacterium sp. MYb72]|uniref:DUF7507 domain-containing protein n=1 Tax=Microbacterium sp. MYb72 TaxID=1848693 RepID=UPI000CFE1541|nr:DUF11 domain-containing protein [Microbacterium sp. MYb72]PRB08730.1 hypothetical protein CQ047_11760 [Microbacterium sp. MYb72]
MARSARRSTHAAPPGLRSRRGRTAGLAAAALAIGAVAIPGGVASPAPAFAADAIDCSAIYAMNSTNGSGSTLWSIDTATGAQTEVGEIAAGADARSTFNALGVHVTPEHPGGLAYVMRSDHWTTNKGAMETYDFATGTTTSVDVVDLPTGWTSTQTHGATDPKTSRYFHGSTNGGSLNLDARALDSGAREGRVRITFPSTIPGTNGDMAFDHGGNLYVVMSDAKEAAIYVVDARDIILGQGNPAPAVRSKLIQRFTVADPGNLGINGAAFDRDGFLVVSTELELLRIDPMSGEVTSTVTFSEPGVVDLASCTAPSHLTLEKDFPEGRESDDDTDQVRLAASGSGLGDIATQTTGTARGVQRERVLVPVLPGSVVTIEESGTGTDPERYRSSWICLDGASGDRIAGGRGTRADVTIPEGRPDGVGVRCTFTNTPRVEAEILLTKSADVSQAQVGDRVTYSFEVTNSGTSPLSDVTVDETAFTGAGTLSPVECPSRPLALDPDETVTCTATYVLQQDDVDRGSVENTATASGMTLTGTPVTSLPSSAVITSEQAPGLAIVKSTDAAWFWSGSTIDYTFLVTNTGTVTLTDVRVDETEFSGTGSVSAVECPPEAASLRPGQSITCTASYTTQDADLALDTIDNTAVSAGTAPGGEPVESAPSSATTPRGDGDSGKTGQPTPPAEKGENSGPGGLADTGLDLVGPLVAGGAALALLALGIALVRARRHAGSHDG